MSVQTQIDQYIGSQPEPKRSEMMELHHRIRKIMPGAKLWYDDGKNSEGKVISNPNIGYGLYTIKYADGTTKDFFQIGLSGNNTGISVYVMGLKDKTYLPETFGSTLGKAKVTGYCIKFKSIKDIHLDVLETAVRYGFETSNKQ
jgi:hypothetical protein